MVFAGLPPEGHNMDQTALVYPLVLDDNGNLVTTTDPNQIWYDRLQVVLSTGLGERVGDLLYGSRMTDIAFDDVDLIEGEAKSAISYAVGRYLPDIDIVDTTIDTTDAQNGYIGVTILFTVPGGQEVALSTGINLTNLALG